MPYLNWTVIGDVENTMFKVIGIACLVITIDNNLVCVFEDEKKIDLRDSNKLDFF